MSIEAIGAIGAIDGLQPELLQAAAPVAPPVQGFASWFAGEVNSVNTSLSKADLEVQKVATGEASNLHDVMIHLEEARLSFQLLAQVRNRLLEAYQEVMRMQV
ncbi:flagellar hook-basal body complex protein FliE [Oxalobacteraceae bacterium]|nr:flagellar hook-basal body complex protein FliE [Oxalobacteraceae bacterium]